MPCLMVSFSLCCLAAPVAQDIDKLFIIFRFILCLNNKCPEHASGQMLCHIKAAVVKMCACRFCNELAVGVFISRVNKNLLFLKINPWIYMQTVEKQPMLCTAFVYQFNPHNIPFFDPDLRSREAPVVFPDHILTAVKFNC